MMNRHFFLFCALLLGLGRALPSYAQQSAKFQWATAFQGRAAKSDGMPNGAQIDASGNLYTLLKYRGNGTFSTMSVFNADTLFQMALTKLDPQGNIIWQRPIFTPSRGDLAGIDVNFTLYDFALGPDNSVYLQGRIRGWSGVTDVQVGLSGTGGVPVSGTGFFLAKVDSTGHTVWTRRDGNSSWFFGTTENLHVDEAGNAYLSGYFDHTFTLNDGGAAPVTLTQVFPVPVGSSMPRNSTWFASYDASGGFRWARQSVETDSLSGLGISAIRSDATGHLYTQGVVRGTARWGTSSGLLVQSSHPDSVEQAIIRYDAATGAAQRYFRIAAKSFIDPLSFAVDAGGNTFVAGEFHGQVDLGGRVLTSSPGSYDETWVARYDPSGVLQWTSHLHGDTTLIEGRALALDKLGKVYVTGMVGIGSRRRYYFGNLLVTPPPGRNLDVFVCAFDQATGLAGWHRATD